VDDWGWVLIKNLIMGALGFMGGQSLMLGGGGEGNSNYSELDRWPR